MLFQGSSLEPRQFYQGGTSMYYRFLSLLKHASDFRFPGNFFLSCVVQWYSGENSAVGRRWGRRKSQSFGQEIRGKIRKLCISVSSLRFFVQRSRFLRNRGAIEAMKSAMLRSCSILEYRSKCVFSFYRRLNLRSEDGIEWRWSKNYSKVLIHLLFHSVVLENLRTTNRSGFLWSWNCSPRSCVC